LAERLFDIKLKKCATGALDSIVHKTSIQFVISQLHPVIDSMKNPKSLCELYNWIKDSVLENGTKGIDISSLVESLKKGFSNSNQAVRSAAISAFSILNSLSKKGVFFGFK
jgi:cytoskeleton-associated protein 5